MLWKLKTKCTNARYEAIAVEKEWKILSERMDGAFAGRVSRDINGTRLRYQIRSVDDIKMQVERRTIW